MNIAQGSIEREKKLILIVDDEEMVRHFFTQICHNSGYDVIEAKNGKEAVEKARSDSPDLILMDVAMPEMDGFAALDTLRNLESTEHIPVIIVTIADSVSDRLTGVSKGANDYLVKPCNAQELVLRIRNNLKIKEYHDFLKSYNTILEKQVLERTSQLNQTLQNLQVADQKIKDSTIDLIIRLTLTAEYKDIETGAHIKRIGHYCRLMAQKLGGDDVFVENIFYASPIHDIGKVGIPDRILLKPNLLSLQEREIMSTHTLIGGKILQGAVSDVLRMGETIALFHHERWDGTGYPRQLVGDNIPLSARIVNLADIYDAVRSKRPYKPPLDHETTCRIIFQGDSRTQPPHFDPRIIEVFRDVHHQFADIFSTMKG